MTPVPIKPLITSDVLEKIDIRIGTIEAVEDIPNSGKLLALRVDFGYPVPNFQPRMDTDKHES